MRFQVDVIFPFEVSGGAGTGESRYMLESLAMNMENMGVTFTGDLQSHAVAKTVLVATTNGAVAVTTVRSPPFWTYFSLKILGPGPRGGSDTPRDYQRQHRRSSTQRTRPHRPAFRKRIHRLPAVYRQLVLHHRPQREWTGIRRVSRAQWIHRRRYFLPGSRR